jgi:WD40 repeat protein
MVNGMSSDFSTLSVSPDGQHLIVGVIADKQFYILNTSSSRVTSISIPDGGLLYDAVWAPRSRHIVCATSGTRLVLVLSRSGDVIARSKLSNPTHINVGANGTLYVAEMTHGISYSEDDGVTWSSLYNKTDNLIDGLSAGWYCWQAIQVTAGEHTNTVWCIEENQTDWRLRVHTVVGHWQNNTIDRLTWRDFQSVTEEGFNFNTPALDAYGNVFMAADGVSKTAIQVWSASSGQYDRPLQLSQQATFLQKRVAVTSQNGHAMYLANAGGIIDVYTLIYD